MCYTMRMSGIVIVFIRQQHQSQREKTNGIYSAAIRRGWQIQPVDSVFDPATFRDQKRIWSPLGCLIDDSALPYEGALPRRIAKNELLGVPTVLLGRDSTRRRQVFDCSVQNTRGPAIAAVQILREIGISDFAYVGDPNHPSWSIERGRHFAKATETWQCQTYGGADPSSPTGQAELTAWIHDLHKPSGVLLGADHLAMPFYAAVKRTNLTIGKDLFVVGVDDDERLCTTLSPSLTSIKPNFFKAGYNGIEILAQRLEDSSQPPQYVTYEAKEIVRRASTFRQMSDKRVSTGLLYITEHGQERISSEDVAREMGCCRRLAEKLFIRHTGKSILNTIREGRLEKAKSLLENSDYPIDDIPLMCGYHSLPHFKVYFREQTGMTMRDWRRRHRQSASIIARKASISSAVIPQSFR